MEHKPLETLMAGVGEIRRSPVERGRVELIVRRPAVDEREVLEEATLDRAEGLVGDTWKQRGSSRTEDGSSHPGMQLTLMNSRAATLIAGDPERWKLAGDQVYVDLDLSAANLPPGTQLGLGSAVLEVSDQPHRGCAKFAARFGRAALKFVNSDVGVKLNLRGVNARVIEPGTARPGDEIRKLSS
ncbi:MAG: MOSC domain-containing protein [Acidimicrobiia bacterium]